MGITSWGLRAKPPAAEGQRGVGGGDPKAAEFSHLFPKKEHF